MSHTAILEDVGATRKKFRITVKQALVDAAFDAATQEVQSKAEIKGFRKGKVPPSLVRKFFYKDVAEKAFDRVVNNTYGETVKTVDFQIVSYPMIEPVGSFQEKADFEFTATIDINPQVDIKDYKGLTLKTTELVDLDPAKELDKMVDKFRKDMGKFVTVTEARPVKREDYVLLDYHLTEGGKELKDKTRKGTHLHLDGTNLEAIESGLLGMKAGEHKEFSVTFPPTFPDVGLANKTVQFHVTLKSIESLELAEVNDDFAKRFGTESVESFKENLRKSVDGFIDEVRMNHFRPQIIEQVLTKNTFEVPESLIEGTIDRAIHEENAKRSPKDQLKLETDEVRAKFREWATNEVKGVLALGHVARQEGIQVSDDEVSAEIMSYASQNQMDPRELVNKGGRQAIEEFRGRVLIRKVLKNIVAGAKIEKEAVAKA